MLLPDLVAEQLDVFPTAVRSERLGMGNSPSRSTVSIGQQWSLTTQGAAGHVFGGDSEQPSIVEESSRSCFSIADVLERYKDALQVSAVGQFQAKDFLLNKYGNVRGLGIGVIFAY